MPIAVQPVISEDPATVIMEIRAMRMARMHSSVLTSARLLEQQWQRIRHFCVFVTLTYKPEADWEPYHVADYIARLRKWAARRNIPMCYVWVLELTKAGRPHYHVMVWLPKGITLPKSDKQGWWTHGLTRTELARNAVGYLAKYASKGEESALPVPKFARINGSGGLTLPNRLERRWWLLPRYVRNAFGIEDNVIRASGGGFLSQASGELVFSEWKLSSIGKGYLRFVRRPSVSPPWQGPASIDLSLPHEPEAPALPQA